MSPAQDHHALNPGEPIAHHRIPDLVRYVAGTDGRITPERATFDIWARTIVGLGSALVADIIQAYYARHDPKHPDKAPISPGWIRAEANSRIERAQNLAQIDAPRPRKGGRMPRHVLEKFQAKGYLQDRDPSQYA
ncbi:hypothetical protein [Nesterenkonia populi]|uniref:hypothetical protein n=1 Tax=Nesterenkonia populi TaxID=1591087 RepID=UPI0011BDC589|nr:hypothetical protein [Nesterenkonia populi]